MRTELKVAGDWESRKKAASVQRFVCLGSPSLLKEKVCPPQDQGHNINQRTCCKRQLKNKNVSCSFQSPKLGQGQADGDLAL